MHPRIVLSAALLACLLAPAKAQDSRPATPKPEAKRVPDMSRVLKGQVYTFQLENGVQEQMSVLEVDLEGGLVRYALTRLIDAGEGPGAIGDPVVEKWESAEAEDMSGDPREREVVSISGLDFDCRIVKEGPGEATWIPMDGDLAVFPGYVKIEVGGKVAAQLVRIAGGEKPALAAPAGEESGQEPAAADLSHVKVGQVYVYQMQNKMTAQWKVTGLTESTVDYEMMIFMDMGQGPQAIGEPTAQTWEYVASFGEVAPPAEDEPETRRETVTVSGIEFDCLVFEGNGAKTWVTMTPHSDSIPTFPGFCRSTDDDGQDMMVLVEVRQP